MKWDVIFQTALYHTYTTMEKVLRSNVHVYSFIYLVHQGEQDLMWSKAPPANGSWVGSQELNFFALRNSRSHRLMQICQC